LSSPDLEANEVTNQPPLICLEKRIWFPFDKITKSLQRKMTRHRSLFL